MYKVTKVEKIVDGDTIYLTVDLGFHVTFFVKLRLKDVDTPELNSKDEKEREDAEWFKNAVTTVLAKLASSDTPLFVESKRKGKYGRWIGDIVWLSDGEQSSLSELLIRLMNEKGLM